MAVTLLDRLVAALPGAFALGVEPGPVPVAFSAGIDKNNLAATVALGLEPVTVCSDLLRPGGYGRLAQGLRSLGKQMAAEGSPDLEAWRKKANDEAINAGYRDAIAARAAELRTPAGAAAYGKAAKDKPLRSVDQTLQMFDCVACNNCVSVCPNNAFVAMPTGGTKNLAARDQYLVLAELCNDCGNCTTFCPENGAPQQVKPRLFFQTDAFAAEDGGFFLSGDSGHWKVQAGLRETAESADVLAELLSGEGASGLPISRPQD
jgi:putative selenate reductase